MLSALKDPNIGYFFTILLSCRNLTFLQHAGSFEYARLDIHDHQAGGGRGNYRTRQHRTVVFENLPFQAGVHFFN